MKTIVAGSRDLSAADTEMAIAASGFANDISEVVCGGARGPDTHGESWALRVGLPVKRFPAQWETYGKKAGMMRNVQMVEYADALVAVWDGKSRGTKHTIGIAREKGLRVYVHEVLQRI